MPLTNVAKLVFLVVISVGLLYVSGKFIGDEAMFFCFLLWLATNVGIYWFSDRVVLKMCRAELLTVYHSPTIFRTVEEMSKQAALPIPKIYMIPEEAPNVCSVGRNPSSAGLVFTDGILKSLTPDELRCTIAHELVHIYRRDILLGTLGAVFAGFLGMSTKSSRERASGQEQSNKGDSPLERFVFRGVFAISAPLAAFIIQTLIDLKRDFRADEYGARLVNNPLAMANVIRTMEKKKQTVPMRVVPAVAHLFMVSPIRHRRIDRMFSTHPSMVQRIERLEALDRSMFQRDPLSGKVGSIDT